MFFLDSLLIMTQLGDWGGPRKHPVLERITHHQEQISGGRDGFEHHLGLLATRSAHNQTYLQLVFFTDAITNQP